MLREPRIRELKRQKGNEKQGPNARRDVLQPMTSTLLSPTSLLVPQHSSDGRRRRRRSSRRSVSGRIVDVDVERFVRLRGGRSRIGSCEFLDVGWEVGVGVESRDRTRGRRKSDDDGESGFGSVGGCLD